MLILRLLAIADTHLGLKTGRTVRAREKIYNSMFDAFEKTLLDAREKKVDYILHAGDLFNRSKPPKNVIARAFQLIENLVSDDIGFIIVPGNHDRGKLPDTLLPFYYEQLHIIRNFTTIKIEDVNVIGFPFERNSTRDIIDKINKIASMRSKEQFIVLCHQVFKTAWFGPHQHYFLYSDDAISTHALPSNIRLVITGHIHRAQSLQRKRVVYPGSTERSSFVETIEPKGYLDIKLDSDYHKIEFCKIPSYPIKVVEIPLNGFPLIPSNVEEFLPQPEIRTLLRLTGRKLTQLEIDNLLRHFHRQSWPLLSITPISTEKRLQALYNKYHRKFIFNIIESKEQ